MSELRKTFNVVNGVPTAVDVFFSIRSLSQKLEVVLHKIKTSFALANKIIQHSKIIYNVEDIADLYAKLQKNELSFNQFGEKIHKYLQTVTTFELQNRLKKMILGQGTLDTPGNDIYNSYKREYLSHNGGGCLARFNEDIRNFRENLANLDEALGEALLLHEGGLNYKTSSCETQDCCSDQYGKFKCSNGRCIRKNWLCDGDNDCKNNDDESRYRCPNYVRSGDLVALRSNAKSNQWVSCWCTVNCDVDRCKL